MTQIPDDAGTDASDDPRARPQAGPVTDGGQLADGEQPAGTGQDQAPGQDQAAGQGQPTTPGPQRKRRKVFRELVIIVAVALILTLLVKAFVIQVYRIPSASMDNTLLPGDRVLVNKLVYHFRGIARGDIIVFSGAGSWGNLDGTPVSPPPSNPVVRFFDDVLADMGLHSDTTFYIKRVIGLPGDHVACCTKGFVMVNGVALHETGYLYPGAAPSTTPFNITVPAGRLWVMGDNRDFSDDSRGHMNGYPGLGTVPVNEVTGRAFLIVWPLSRFGDLPIPDTFKQPALTAAPALGLAAVVAAPLLLRRRRKSRHA
jgi:signal peptidase I